MTAAVCYVASGAGYLFPTVVSALQARAKLDPKAEVCVVYFALPEENDEEYEVFAGICERGGVVSIRAELGILQGLGPTFARYFLDTVLPPELDRLLYLDGDTQVLDDLAALLDANPQPGGALAALDPMVFIRKVDAGLGKSIDEWWDSSEIPESQRAQYVNSGMLRIDREALRSLRTTLLGQDPAKLNRYKFLDQDALNLTLGPLITPVSMSWNFPGFLLGTHLEKICSPRVLHFMSNPRPWNAALEPWGRAHFQPYVDFTDEHPEARKYWRRFRGSAKFRYLLQQRYKRWSEGRVWASENAAREVAQLECSVLPV